MGAVTKDYQTRLRLNASELPFIHIDKTYRIWRLNIIHSNSEPPSQLHQTTPRMSQEPEKQTSSDDNPLLSTYIPPTIMFHGPENVKTCK